jgi:aspartate-semialdehyde dehydrogenase
MKVAVVGATGLVGRTILTVLSEFSFPVSQLLPVASEQSVGQSVDFEGKSYTIKSIGEVLEARPDVCFFAAGSDISAEMAPKFAEQGTLVVDNSSYWRMQEQVPLVVPEVNPESIGQHKLIANPNCSTIQLVVALAPLHRAYGIKRIVVSTYQSVSGTGKKGLDQLAAELQGQSHFSAYANPIAGNCLPQCDVFDVDDYTKEEWKIVNETRKILGDASIAISSTAIRVPVAIGHSESVNIEFHQPFDVAQAKALLVAAPGILVQDDPANGQYPMAIHVAGKNEVFVGRIRRDSSVANGLNLWVVADNLRKGAATNAVQIAQVWAKSASILVQ